MSITVGPAYVGQVSAYTYATLLNEDPRTEHITGVQVSARNMASGPNMMILHFPGDYIEFVDGPQSTIKLMEDLTQGLPAVESDPASRNDAQDSLNAVNCEDYFVVLAEEARDIRSATDLIPDELRPEATEEMEVLLSFFESTFSDHCFVLACWRTTAAPSYPIVVKYVPHNDDVLFVPGIQASDSIYPDLDLNGRRNFRIALAVDGCTQPYQVAYRDEIDLMNVTWAPSDVTGFVDNRLHGNNGDYLIPVESITHGFAGLELFENRIF